MTGQQQTEQGQAFDAWSRDHQFHYQDRQGARIAAGRGRIMPSPEETEVHFSIRPGDGGHLVFLPLDEAENLRDRLTQILDETRLGPVGDPDGAARVCPGSGPASDAADERDESADGLVYVRTRHGDVARTEQVTDTIRVDWSAPNPAGEADVLGVEVLNAFDVEIDGRSVAPTPPAGDTGDEADEHLDHCRRICDLLWSHGYDGRIDVVATVREALADRALVTPARERVPGEGEDAS